MAQESEKLIKKTIQELDDAGVFDHLDKSQIRHFKERLSQIRTTTIYDFMSEMDDVRCRMIQIN